MASLHGLTVKGTTVLCSVPKPQIPGTDTGFDSRLVRQLELKSGVQLLSVYRGRRRDHATKPGVVGVGSLRA